MTSIWFISKYGATPDQGGSQRQFSLSNNFSKQNIETSLIISRSNGCKLNPVFKRYYKQTKLDDLNVITLNGPLLTSLGFSYKRILSWIIFEFHLLRLAFSTPKDKLPQVVIVSSLSFLTILTGIILKKKFKSKLIVEIRDIWPLTLTSSGRFSKNNLIIRLLVWIEKLGYKKADGIVGSMPKLDEHIKKTINEPFKFRCIPMGFSEYQYKHLLEASGKEIKSEFSFPKKKFVIGYAGAIGKLNIVNEIIETARILKDNKEIFFAVFGKGPQRKRLEEDSRDLKNIKFYGSASKAEIVPILKKCDLLLMPINNSPIYEYGVSPNKWIDYMLSGRPILLSYSGYRSLINEADCGFFIEANKPNLMAQEITSILKIDKTVLDRMGKQGYDYVINNRSYEKLSTEYVEFINSI
jgi:glycosyltransferase involved in cell wall biosynthesis